MYIHFINSLNIYRNHQVKYNHQITFQLNNYLNHFVNASLDVKKLSTTDDDDLIVTIIMKLDVKN